MGRERGGHVIVDYRLTVWQKATVLKLRHLNDELIITNTQPFTSHDVNWWTGNMWITSDVFICCLDSHSDSANSLARIQLLKWCNATFSKSVPQKKQTHLHREYMLSKCSFLVNYSFKLEWWQVKSLALGSFTLPGWYDHQSFI